ncbi:host cell division inhibitor Icd-like protein [Salmonella enterica]|nr:host cell division inhibitor Icd-like protein [Salmonella enterica]
MQGAIMNKFTWLFQAIYPDHQPPVVMRTQAGTEEDARRQLSGEWSLIFVAKLNTACPVNHQFYAKDDQSMWGIVATSLTHDDIMQWGNEVSGSRYYA